MKKLLFIFLMLIPLVNVHGQHPMLTQWYDTLREIAQSQRYTQVVSLKKEVLYNGSIIPIAHGKFIYLDNDGIADTIQFLYSFGRITIPKTEFDQMTELPYSTSLIVGISFRPIRLSEFEKENDGPCFIEFTTKIGYIKELYSVSYDDWFLTNIHSFWAITTLSKCYKVTHHEHGFTGKYYHIPYEGRKRDRILKKLDRLFSKQYENSYAILNYFYF